MLHKRVCTTRRGSKGVETLAFPARPRKSMLNSLLAGYRRRSEQSIEREHELVSAPELAPAGRHPDPATTRLSSEHVVACSHMSIIQHNEINVKRLSG